MEWVGQLLCDLLYWRLLMAFSQSKCTLMLRLLLPVLFSLTTLLAFGQKKQLSPADLATWNTIQYRQISHDGNYVAYTLRAEEGDGVLHVWNATTGETTRYGRGERGTFSADSRHLVFLIKPHADSLREMRRRKVAKDDLPNDTLCILNLSTNELERIPDVRSFSVPEKWSGWVACQLEAQKPAKAEPVRDSTATAPPDSLVALSAEKEKVAKRKQKKESAKNGTRLLLRELSTGEDVVVPFVKQYELAEEGRRVLFVTTGTEDSTWMNGVYLFHCEAKESQPLFIAEGEYKNLTMDKRGDQAAFLANLDTTKAIVPPFRLAYWKGAWPTAAIIADTSSRFLPPAWGVSEHGRPVFSDDGSRLFFGMAPPPLLQDTSLLDDEIVNVEVWSYNDGLLHTHQKSLLDREKRRNYDVVFFPDENRFVSLADEKMPEITYAEKRNASVAIGYTDAQYQQLISWEGSAHRDVWLLDLKTGERKEIINGLRGNPSLSPNARYAYWYSEPDSAWFSWDTSTGVLRQITNNRSVPFFNELNDVPDYPDPYGIATWTKGDRYLLVYDRYDIWQVDPNGAEAPLNLTGGRNTGTVYRFIRTDPENNWVESGQRLLLRIFDEENKSSGYGYLVLGAGNPIQLVKEAYAYTRMPQKARDAERILFTKERFETFPDLLYSDLTFRNPRRVSHANPQQADYSWGTAELFEWTSLEGQRLQGILVKPDDFDPQKQYPMIVNFYERSSDGLHQHRPPSPHRSTINYSYYASRGYLVFNPDIPYKIGYPGESCLNAVVPGVTALIDAGFVDKNRIGLQGHSWGGYQVAYLITKTNLFRCAESGAPVVNMFSAYGGIRWQTGLSRMFQYEHTQSRIGGTIWEYPLRYFENSPLFFLDKVKTPVLIMHNDSDGHVPWYQGIEFFVAMRRLGKPAWLLNYNDEPHWPLKLQHRKDFQLRMSQFFDHYLKDAPTPSWMLRGVPAVEKGILQGLE